MELKHYYLILAVCGGVWNGIASGLIYFDLRSRGERVSFLLLRMLAPWYAHKYRKLTLIETGRAGALWYHWIVSANAALVFALVALALHFTRG